MALLSEWQKKEKRTSEKRVDGGKAETGHPALDRQFRHDALECPLRIEAVVWRELEDYRTESRRWEEYIYFVREEESVRVDADAAKQGLGLETKSGGEGRGTRVGA